jgi:hypothetical protein
VLEARKNMRVRALPLCLSLVLGFVASVPNAVARPNSRASSKPPAVVDAPDDVRASQLTRHGEAARERGDHPAAARAYEAAYDAMPDPQKHGNAGAFVLGNAVRSYEDAFEATRSVGELEAARAMLLRFVEQRRGAGASIPAFVESELVALERDIVAATPAPDPEPTPPALLEAPPPPPPVVRPTRKIEPFVAPPVVDDRLLRRRHTGAALIVAGGLVAGVGAVLLGVGATIGPAARRDRDEGLGSPEYAAADPIARHDYDAAIDTYVRDSQRVSHGLAGGGAAAIGVGLTTLIVGAVMLARARRAAKLELRATHAFRWNSVARRSSIR